MFVMSAVFRTMAAVTKTVSQAMALSGVLILAIVVYTGFTVPVSYMHPWFGWIRYINPVRKTKGLGHQMIHFDMLTLLSDFLRFRDSDRK